MQINIISPIYSFKVTNFFTLLSIVYSMQDYQFL